MNWYIWENESGSQTISQSTDYPHCFCVGVFGSRQEAVDFLRSF